MLSQSMLSDHEFAYTPGWPSAEVNGPPPKPRYAHDTDIPCPSCKGLMSTALFQQTVAGGAIFICRGNCKAKWTAIDGKLKEIR